MAKAKEYNGYPSWNQWNVSLWTNNDEGLYNWACDLTRQYGVRKAATIMANELDGIRTPDGARYNVTSILGAIRGILE